MVFAVVDVCGRTLCFSVAELHGLLPTVGDIKVEVSRRIGLPVDDQYVLLGGRMVCDNSPLIGDCLAQVRVRGSGGKGGFGSLLKGAATGWGFDQAPRKNFGACRDLHGRRVRHVENDRKLREWERGEKFTKEKELKERLEKRKKRKFEQLIPPQAPAKKPEDAMSPEELVKNLDTVRTSVSEAVQQALKKSKKNQTDETNDDSAIDIDIANIPFDSNTSSAPQTSAPTSSSSSSSAPTTTSLPISIPLPFSDTAVPMEPERPSTNKSSTPTTTLTSSSSSSSSSKPNTSQHASKQQQQQQQQPKELELSQVESVEQLEALGLEQLKVELQKRGLKCGGGLSERAARLFAVRGLSPSQYPAKLLAK